MRKIASKKDRKEFYTLSKYVLVFNVVMCVLAGVIAVCNFMVRFLSTAVGSNIHPWGTASIILSTINSIVIVINWFIVRYQKERLDAVIPSNFAWWASLIMDVLSIGNIILNTITSLYNGDIIVKSYEEFILIVMVLLMGISATNLAFAIYFVIISKKSWKTNMPITLKIGR